MITNEVTRDGMTGDTIVTVTWNTGETLQYTITSEYRGDAHSDLLAVSVFITGYGCPGDFDFSNWDWRAQSSEWVNDFDTVAEAVAYCTNDNAG